MRISGSRSSGDAQWVSDGSTDTSLYQRTCYLCYTRAYLHAGVCVCVCVCVRVDKDIDNSCVELLAGEKRLQGISKAHSFQIPG